MGFPSGFVEKEEEEPESPLPPPPPEKVFFPSDKSPFEDDNPSSTPFTVVLPVNLPLPVTGGSFFSSTPPTPLFLPQKQSSAYWKSLLKAPNSASREVKDTNSVVALTLSTAEVTENTESSTKVTLTSTADVDG